MCLAQGPQHSDTSQMISVKQSVQLIFKSNCVLTRRNSIGPQGKKTCFREFVNNKGADQTAWMRSLISAFVILLLECIILKRAAS